MTHSATHTFHAYAADYDAARRRLVPMFDTFYGTAVQALGLAPGPITRVLDLGAGTGLLSRRVPAAHPGAEWHLERFREAGFADAPCLFKDHSFAVLVARA